jgi:CRISPR-associated endonuclease/helicase Cas3
MKQMAQFSVNIRKHDFDKLKSIGAIEEPFESIYVITNPAFYHDDTGLSIENQWLEETYII